MNAINAAAVAAEWSIRMADGSFAILAPESSLVTRISLSIKSFFKNLILVFCRFLEKSWNIGMNEPRKVIHCIKVGIALSVVSLFYYMKPLYEGVGGTAMWAVLTVVVVFEYTVGATLYKCLNRATGTFLAGFLAIGIHWIANQSGKRFEPIIMGTSIFILGSAATFSRFIPAVKARFDYGAMIFILTFTLVSISGYRVKNLLTMAHERVSTIIIGASLCVITSILIYPIWAGEELHKLVISNLEKQADSLECCVAEYFSDSEDTTTNTKKMLAFKCVLNAKASEETMASEFLRKQLTNTCQRVSSSTAEILRELAMNMKTMRKSSRIDILVQEKNSTIQELETQLKQASGLLIVPKGAKNEKDEEKPVVRTSNVIPMVEIIPAATFASLVIEIATRIEGVVDAVEELSKMAKFKIEDAEKMKQSKSVIKIIN